MKKILNMSALYITAVIIAVSAFMLPRVIEAVSLHIHGISHIAEQTEDYYHITEPIEDEYSVELDLTDPESNKGKVLFDDGDNTVSVLEVVPRGESGFEVIFRSRGSERADGAALISGVEHGYTEDGFTHSLKAEAVAAFDNGEPVELSSANSTSLIHRDGDQFSFLMDTPSDSEAASITLSNLQLNLWGEIWWH
ncbi:hypothetical protein M4S82_02145 [Planococcus sp. MERTA32b]|nr:hypothetical protein [Planococcus sp. MER TA 32b]